MAALIQLQDGAGGLRTELPLPVCRIGRGAENDVCIDDELVSREHAILELVRSEQDGETTHFILRDLDSTNGTFVNHERIKATVIETGDTIRIGKSFFRFAEDGNELFGETLMLRKTLIPGLFVTREKKG
jgi:pSer/pThr/pTyr-binding forkhead associated (FHA) protein